ncbi:recombinase family protein [Bowdeniella nasicola]|uniref:recombinase family protein n=1 Tax=Bowdeniella nasicola TaxID=208480 RepID=UPI000B2954B3|nr:recombinase family protein [Bowdeniella nasicola]
MRDSTRTWRAQIIRDDAGEPIRGQWAPIVDDETWWKVQEILDDKKRVTNTSGSTKRKRLGSGLYRCGLTDSETGQVCGKKVTGAPRGYTCPGHMVRSSPAIDDFVTEVISARLAEKDAVKKMITPAETAQTRSIDASISGQRARINRAQHDYDAEIIEGHDLKRVRDAAEERIQELEAQKMLQGRTGALLPILGVDDPATAFKGASLELRRQIIDVLATVSLLPQPRGRKGVNPASVEIVWK